MQRNMNRIIHPTEWNKEQSTQNAAEDSQEAPQPQLADSTIGFQSEHGHNLAAIAPLTKHSGASVVTFFNGLFTTIIGIATLGASITFSYVVGNVSEPLATAQSPFDQQTIQNFLSISWLLFLLGLAFASLGSTMLTFFRAHWVKDWDGLHGRTSQRTVQWYAVIASTTLGALTIAAFVFLCLVVAAYSSTVGWIALGFVGVFGVIIVIAVFNQTPFPWRDNRPNPAEVEEVRKQRPV